MKKIPPDSGSKKATNPPTDSSRRQWPRESAVIPMVFVVDAGKRRLPGVSKDVSLGGVALNLNSVPDTILPGQEGWIELNFDRKVHRFPCRIVRTAATNVFVAMDEQRRAEFASLVSLIHLSSLRDNFDLLERWDATRGGKENLNHIKNRIQNHIQKKKRFNDS